MVSKKHCMDTQHITNLILDALDTEPAAQNEGVVGRDDGNGIDALCLELVVFCDIWREMANVAGGLLKELVASAIMTTRWYLQ